MPRKTHTNRECPSVRRATEDVSAHKNSSHASPTQMIRSLAAVVICALAGVAAAKDAPAKQVPPEAEGQRFHVEGARLHYDGSVEDADGEDAINEADTKQFHALLKAHSEIGEVVLRSDGGNIYDALDIATIVTDYGLDTRVDSYCVSACTLIFLAGERRFLGLGGRLGFHGVSWARDDMKDYYEDRREAYGWMDEFAFASWTYEEGMRDVNRLLAFLAAEDIDLDFIVRAGFVHSDDMWFPTRQELLDYGIITPLTASGARVGSDD